MGEKHQPVDRSDGRKAAMDNARKLWDHKEVSHAAPADPTWKDEQADRAKRGGAAARRGRGQRD